MTEQLIATCLLTLMIHAAETLSYAVRLAGVRMRKLAVALSLTGVIVLVSRTSNMVQGIFTGYMIDVAKTSPDAPLDAWFHLILLSATAGTMLAILLFPTGVKVAMRLVAGLETAGSIPRLVKASVTVEKMSRIRHHIRYPRLEMLRRLRAGGIPKRLLLLNVLITGIYTTGVLSALYASYLLPGQGTTASMSSGLINGIATVLLTLFVDPQVALLMDRSMSGQVPSSETNKMFGLLMLSRCAGTLLAQALLLPGAQLIAWFVGWFG